jgi:hypothetical protein
MFPLPLADFFSDPEGAMAMVIGFGMVVVIPLVAMLLQHQRKMAEMMRDRAVQSNESQDRRMEAMERRIEELGYRINDAVLRSDDRMPLERETPPPVEDLHRRLNG